MDTWREPLFWAKVDKSGECWIWTGSRSELGYGRFAVSSHPTRALAHRASWELVNGPIAPGLDVCHHCDNPPCVRPDHLFLGTRLANMQDAKSKGRTRSGFITGSANSAAKLTEKQVADIRRRYAAQEAGQSRLGREYGVAHSTIRAIVLGRKWRFTGDAITPLPPVSWRRPLCRRGHPMKTIKSGRQVCNACERLRAHGRGRT